MASVDIIPGERVRPRAPDVIQSSRRNLPASQISCPAALAIVWAYSLQTVCQYDLWRHGLLYNAWFYSTMAVYYFTDWDPMPSVPDFRRIKIFAGRSRGCQEAWQSRGKESDLAPLSASATHDSTVTNDNDAFFAMAGVTLSRARDS